MYGLMYISVACLSNASEQMFLAENDGAAGLRFSSFIMFNAEVS